MGLTDVYSITVHGVKNFKSAIDREESARKDWTPRWGWMLDVYKEMNENLEKLRKKKEEPEDELVVKETPRIPRSVLPFPNSTGHEYGWLASKSEFALETVGPMPQVRKIPIENPRLYEDRMKFYKYRKRIEKEAQKKQ